MNLPIPFAELCQITRQAGEKTLAWWKQPLEVIDKPDHSPVTAADLAAHVLITEALQALTPGIPVLSEEAADVPLSERLNWQRFWLVDPLDGTKEFIAGTDEFTVNIALIEDGEVVLGVVGVPAKNVVYWGGRGLGAWRQRGNDPAQPILARDAGTPLTVVASRRHTSPEQEAMMARLEATQPVNRVNVGSSLKFCLVAEGAADLYPRFGPTSQWDTAAAQAVVEGAGGLVIGLDGQRFSYPPRETWLNPFFIALGNMPPALLAELLG
ncbi:MAG TPA: 3'(2'),5'-bisphosphate nucleotidase [Pseudomonas xinjiangensis]|uniref:3'(2'),5'-bisphosphate nucleotidase CysQ n=2 Tax=root TaxID=1 RepID=A0A7V1BNH8_9GAMM|nr:3'(2'),5'-bisphosphate nucleotidase [Halopseudomonas xinjiangensis]HEC48555.1 3'(2'),5'-bisphosphate nucleotidase [Halopseudomonas xinjiangensis]